MKILVDTNIIIDYLRSPLKDKTQFHTLFIKEEHTAVINLVTITELYAGKSVATNKTRNIIDALIDSCEIIEGNTVIYKKAGEIIRSNYCHSVQDAIIAASAIFSHIPLLTLNTADFKKVKELMFYKTKNSV